MTKKRHRLFVSKIMSIGAVERGDNADESVIMLYKSAAPESGGGGRDRSGSGSAPSPVTATAALFARVDRTLAMAKQRSLPSTEKEKPTMNRKPEGRSSALILAQVDQLAANISKSGGISRSQSRAEVWRVHPELRTEIRKAQARERGGIVADEEGKTISDRVRQVIDEAAAQASLRPLMENWGRGMSREQVISKVRVEMWRTPDGQALRDLDRAVGSKPYTPAAVAEIHKSRDAARFTKALEVLDHGLQLPG